ncbi:MAG: hypothetical protein COU51_04285 [Parcubacteria group bacterium CG10_big_fil_rev_8_21_14_0_10_36_14]|nr:MAG: hypothetical protein COU51_04285 [Parcubacteria group bacterium CG10_big_fil_rev_8_21_14_0_10_36_14]
MANLFFILLFLLTVGVFIAGFFIIRNLRKPVIPEVASIKQKWEETQDLAESNAELSWKMSVIEADKLMDSVLKQAGMRGETMGERLRFAVSRYPKIQNVWEAHILRNDLVHQSDRKITQAEAQKALDRFKQGLKILGAL